MPETGASSGKTRSRVHSAIWDVDHTATGGCCIRARQHRQRTFTQRSADPRVRAQRV